MMKPLLLVALAWLTSPSWASGPTPEDIERRKQWENPAPLSPPVGGFGRGYIPRLWVSSKGAMLIYMPGPITGAPQCASAGRFSIDTTTPAGRAQSAVLQTAWVIAKQVLIYGDGTCSVHPDSETVRDIYVLSD